MNRTQSQRTRPQTFFAAVLCAAVMGGLASTLWSAETKADAPPAKTAGSAATNSNAVEPNAKPSDPPKPKVKKPLTGAELYSINCNRCHPERYPTERTAAQWKTIMLHMQVRANLPVNQAKLILKYLQENSGR